jgi:hypothetical protein
MITEAEFLYFTNVLGTEPFQVLDDGPEPGKLTIHETIVCAPLLSAPEIGLLSKILKSVKLEAFQMLEMDSMTPAQVMALKGRHIITFIDAPDLKAPEVVAFGEKFWWRLWPLSSLLSENEAVNTERKKQIWTLLQKFASRSNIG